MINLFQITGIFPTFALPDDTMGKSKISRINNLSRNSKYLETGHVFVNQCINESSQLQINEDKIEDLGSRIVDVTSKEQKSSASDFKFFANCASESLTTDSRTGYADALKRNLRVQNDIKSINEIMEKDILLALQLEKLDTDDSQLSRIMLTNKDVSMPDINPSLLPKTNQSDLNVTTTDKDNENNKAEASSDCLTNAMYERLKLESLVANLATTSENSTILISEDRCHWNKELWDIDPSNPKPNCKRLHRSESLSVGQPIGGGANLQSEFKTVTKNNACLKKNARTAKNTDGKRSKDSDKLVDYKDEHRRKTVAYRFLNSKYCTKRLNKPSSQRTTTIEGLANDKKTNVASRRTYSEVARGESSFKNTKLPLQKVPQIKVPLQRRYSDVTRSGLNQDMEIINELNHFAIEPSLERQANGTIYSTMLRPNSFPGHFKYDELNDTLSDCKILEIMTDSRGSDEVASKYICQPNYLQEELIIKTEKKHSFEEVEGVDNQENARTVQEIYFDSQKCTNEKSLELNQNNGAMPIDIDDYMASIGRLKKFSHRKKVSQKLITKAFVKRNPLSRNLRHTIALNHRELLQKPISKVEQSISPNLSSVVSLCEDFENTCSLSDGSLNNNNSDRSSPTDKTVFNVPSLENDKENVVVFFDNILKHLKHKKITNNSSVANILHNHNKNIDIGQESQESKESELNITRKPTLEICLNNHYETSKENQPQLLHSHYPRLIKCQTDSQWHTLLKDLQPCVSLAQLLLPFSEIPRFDQATHLKYIQSETGKVVFSTKLEHSLREGSLGTYIGALEGGNPVVVRQLSSSAISKELREQTIFKRHLLAHKNLAILYDVHINPKDLTISLISELCEYSLPQYMKRGLSSTTRTMAPPLFFRKLLVMDLMEGIRYLHEMNVVHGFLKPSNIMVTIEDRLKVTDYHLHSIAPLTWGIQIEDPKLKPIGSSISSYCWRPTELIRAKNESEARTCLTTASDIQMCGMLVFYILSDGRHPFGSADRTCQENIRTGNLSMGLHLEDIESADLVREMTKADPEERPTIQEVLRHPYFWDKEKRYTFLLEVGRKMQFYSSKQSREVEEFRRSCIETRNWTNNIHRDLLKFLCMCTNKTFSNDFSDLLEFAVALQIFFQAMPIYLKNIVKHPTHFILLKFPGLFMSVYDVIRSNPLLITQMMLQEYF